MVSSAAGCGAVVAVSGLPMSSMARTDHLAANRETV
jgi:hypothetical protein